MLLSRIGAFISDDGEGPPPLWTPAEISTVLWLDAADSSTLFDATSGGSLPAPGGNIKRWEDKSGSDRHAVSVGSTFPTYQTNVQNGLPITRWPGNNTTILRWSSPLFNTAVQYGVFIVQKTSGDRLLLTHSSQNIQFRIGQTGNHVINMHPITGAFSHVLTVPRTSFSLVEYTRSPLNQVVYYESGNFKGSLGVSSSVANATNQIGPAFFGLPPLGDIAEYVIFQGEVTTEIRQKIEGYLAHKWGLVSQLPVEHPYKSTPPYL